jgi:hypothetical protein
MPRPALTPFELHNRHGLLLNGQPVLPAGYDAVWELGRGFWGYRRGNWYGVVAPDGRLVCGCVLPATVRGYRMLSWPEQRRWAERPDDRAALAELGVRHPHLRQYLRVPCVPRRWAAEDILHHLWEKDAGWELHLPGRDADLVLYGRGGWDWEPADPVRPLPCQLEHPSDFRWLEPEVLRAPDPTELLWWRWRCLRRLRLALLWGDNWPDALRQTVYEGRDEAWYELSLHRLLRTSDVAAPPEPPFPAYCEEELPAAVRAACLAHLAPYLTRCGACPSAPRRLLKLAWLWAHGRVEVDLATDWARVDVRYHEAGDYDPIRQEPTTPLALYRRYRLHRLVAELLTSPDA